MTPDTLITVFSRSSPTECLALIPEAYDYLLEHELTDDPRLQYAWPLIQAVAADTRPPQFSEPRVKSPLDAQVIAAFRVWLWGDRPLDVTFVWNEADERLWTARFGHWIILPPRVILDPASVGAWNVRVPTENDLQVTLRVNLSTAKWSLHKYIAIRYDSGERIGDHAFYQLPCFKRSTLINEMYLYTSCGYSLCRHSIEDHRVWKQIQSDSTDHHRK
jgi:hypothetical protein